MPRTGSRPARPELAAYAGRIVVYDHRGAIRVAKWPRKSGPTKSLLKRAQNEWFAAVNQLIKFAPAEQHIAAMDATKGSGVYPRDLLMHTISEGIMDITELDGTFVQHRRPRVDGVAFQGFRIPVDVPFSVPANTTRTVPLTAPVLDTAAFWDFGDPDLITIPAGVTVMSFGFEYATSTNVSGRILTLIRGSISGLNLRNDVDYPFGGFHSTGTGPVPVIGGETWIVQLHNTGGQTYDNALLNVFWGKIEGTT